MTCDAIRQLLLSLDLDEKSRRRVAEALAHLDTCQACRQALRDFDALAALLRLGQPLEPFLPLDAGSDDNSARDLPTRLADQPEISPAGGWDAFEDKLRAAARGRRRPVLSWHRLLFPVGSLAAMIVVVTWTAYHLGKAARVGQAHLVPTPIVTPSRSTPAADRLLPGDVADKVRTFDAIDHSFSGRTRWLMFSGSREADVGLIDQCPQSPPTRGERILLLRLNLLRDADLVSQADVLIVPGTTANVVVPTRLGPLQYHIVTSALEPMRLRVQVQMARDRGAGPDRRPGGTATAVLGTSLDLEPYHDAAAGRLVLDRQGFDLQVAAAAYGSAQE